MVDKQNFEGNIYSNLIAALILSFHFINGAVGIDGISVVTIAFILLLCAVGCIKKKVIIHGYVLAIVFLIFVDFVVSFLRVPDSNSTIKYFGYFVAFSIVALISGTQNIDYEKVVKLMVIIGLLGLPFYLLRGFADLSSSTNMGAAYGILPIFFASFIGLFSLKKVKIISGLCVALSLYFFVSVAPRGIWLSILFFLFFFILFRIARTKSGFKHKAIVLVSFILVFVLTYSFVNNFVEIIKWIDSFLNEKMNISINALKKMIYYTNQNNLVNGRDSLWQQAIDYIADRPVFGTGIGYFESYNDGSYVHSIIFEMLCENGLIIGGIILLWVFGKSLFFLLSQQKYKTAINYDYVVLIVTCGILMLVYSSSYWLFVPFWHCIGFFLKKSDRSITFVEIKHEVFA